MKKTILVIALNILLNLIGFSQTNLLWQKSHSWKNVEGKIEVFAIDKIHNTYIAGFCRQGNFYKPIVSKFDSLGNHKWTTIIPVDSFQLIPNFAKVRSTDNLLVDNNKLVLSTSFPIDDTVSVSGIVCKPILSIINIETGTIYGTHLDSFNHYNVINNSTSKKINDTTILKVLYVNKTDPITSLTNKQYVIQHFDTLAHLKSEQNINASNGFGEVLISDSTIYMVDVLNNTPSFVARIIKSDFTGNILTNTLSNPIFSSSYNGANPFHFSMDKFENFYLGGNCFKSNGQMEYYISKLNSTVNVQFAKALPDFATIYSNEGNVQVYSSTDNNTFLSSPQNNNDILQVARYNNNGLMQWAKQLKNINPYQHKTIVNSRNQTSVFYHSQSGRLNIKTFSNNGDSIFYADFANSAGLNLVGCQLSDSNYIYTLESNADSFVISRFYTAAILTSLEDQKKHRQKDIISFPNPASEFICLKLDDIDISLITNQDIFIRNVLGETFQNPFKIINNTIRIDTSILPDGLYFYSIKHLNMLYSNSFIVKN